jgi:glycosyltransferase involved in cell wall biosynthesis
MEAAYGPHTGALGGEAASKRLQVCVCACTFRRPKGLAKMLEGIARQTFSTMPRPILHVVIADNECSDRTREICSSFEARHRIPVTYVSEPRRGISFARNACLDNIPDGFDFFASIDDDEIPEPDWLERLLEAQAATGADVVQGAVYPIFAEGTPNWLVEGQYFGRPRRAWIGTISKMEEHQELKQAGTGNALVRAASISSPPRRFDPELALTGGEDTMFFRSLQATGGRIVFAPRARVGEYIPPERATPWYRLKIEFRIGNNPLPAPVDPKRRRLSKRLLKRWRDSGPNKMLSGVRYLIAGGLSGDMTNDRLMIAGLRIAFGLGQCARAVGLTYRPYQ